MRRHMLGASAVILAFAASATPGVAQQRPAASPARTAGVLEEVVVTARRQEERLQEVPVAVSALTANDLEKRAINVLADLQTAVPTLQFGSRNNTTGRQGLGVALRGLRSASVIVYESEIRRSTRSINNFFDLGSVEVLKGPQGTLFGAASTAGVLVFRPKTPGNEFEASAEARLGNYSMYGGTGILNMPLGDKFAARIALDGEKRGGYVKRAGLPALDSDGHFGGRLGLLAKPTDKAQNLLTAEYFTDHEYSPGLFPTELRPCTSNTQAACFYGARPIIPAPINRYTGPPIETLFATAQALGPFGSNIKTNPETYSRTLAVSDVADYDFGPILGDFVGDVSARGIVGYVESTSKFVQDNDGYPITAINQSGRSHSYDRSVEGQIRGKRSDGSLNWVVGYYHSSSETKSLPPSFGNFSTQLLFDIGPAVQQVFNGFSVNGNKQSGFYGQATVEIIHNVRLTGGYRHTKVDVSLFEQTFTNGRCSIGGTVGVDVANCSRKVSASFKNPTWTVGLDWQVDPDTLVYAVTRRGFGAGGFNGTVIEPSRLTFKPETVTDIELGLKRDWNLEFAQLRTNVALYRNKYSNIQRSQTIFENNRFSAITVNAAKATLFGEELEAQLAFDGGVTLRLAGAHLKATYDSFPYSFRNAAGVLVPVDLKGNTVAQAPKWTINAGADYRHDFEGYGTFNASTDYTYTSSINYSDFNSNDNTLSNNLDKSSIQKGYGIWSARIGLDKIRGGNVSVDAWVRNLTKKLYFIGLANTGPFGISSGLPGAPRTFGVTVRSKF